MIDTFSLLTLTLARALSVLIIATGLAGLAAPTRWAAIVDDFRASPGLLYLGAIAAFVIGLTLITVHNLWTDPLAIIVTLVGWIALIEGVVLLIAPARWLDMVRNLVASPSRARIIALIVLVFGAGLLGLSLIARATVS